MSRKAPLDNIDIFVEVVNAQSFTRAAARLHMPVNTVSARIKRLEERLGMTLLHRTTRRLSLTDAGARYFEHCAKAMELVEQAERAVATSLEEPRGRLRLTAPADLAQTVLVPAITSYLERYREVELELLVSNQYRDLVGEGIDLAVRVGELQNSSMVARTYFTGNLGLWASPQYLQRFGPIQSLADLRAHRLIRLNTSRVSPAIKEGRTIVQLEELQSNLLVDDMLTCQAYAESGLGIALLPLFTQMNNRPESLIRVLPQVQTGAFPVQFLYPRQTAIPPTVRRFIDVAVGLMKGT